MINCIYHAPLSASPALCPINLSPSVFILTFQTSEQLQTAVIFFQNLPKIFSTFSATEGFFPPNYVVPGTKLGIFISASKSIRSGISWIYNAMQGLFYTPEKIRCPGFQRNIQYLSFDLKDSFLKNHTIKSWHSCV